MMDVGDCYATIHHDCTATDHSTIKNDSGPLSNEVDADITLTPHYLYGPQAIELLLQKPEFSFLIKYYSVLYQSLIPNCRVTINTLKNHLVMSKDTEQYILGEENRRASCQRLLNLLLVHLNSERNFMSFCYLFSKISVMASLPFKLIAEFRSNGNWNEDLSVHPHLTSTLEHCNFVVETQRIYCVTCSAFQDTDALSLTASGCIQLIDNHSVGGFNMYCVVSGTASDDRAGRCSIDIHWCPSGRRRFLGLQVITAIEQPYRHTEKKTTVKTPFALVDSEMLMNISESKLLRQHFELLCSALPRNYQLTIDKLKSIPELSKEDDQQFSTLMPTSPLIDVRTVNEKIITCLIVKLCYNGTSSNWARFCDIMEVLVESTSSSICIQQFREGLAKEFTTVLPSSSTLVVDCLPQASSSVVPAITSNTGEHSVLQPNSCVTLASECIIASISSGQVTALAPMTTSSDVVISTSACVASTVTTTTGVQLLRSRNVLQLLPTDYERTLDIIQDCLTDDQICGVLSCPDYTSANRMMMDCLMETFAGNVLGLCDQLEQIIPLLANPATLLTIIGEIRAGFTVTTPDSQENELPRNLVVNEDFAQFRGHYHTILNILPEEYEITVGKLQSLNFIGDEEIRDILSSGNSAIANKKILNSLIKKMKSKEDLLDLCDQVGKITASVDLKTVLGEIKSEVQQNIPASIGTTVAVSTQSSLSSSQQLGMTLQSKAALQERLTYKDRRLQKGFKYMQPPPLPSNYVSRQALLDEIAAKLCQADHDPTLYGTTLTITGAGGFGKTTTATSLCYHPAVQEQFTDGFAFIELGPQAIDPSIKLCLLYRLLTGEHLKQGDLNYAEQEVKQLTSAYYRNLLVIIDDVWHVEDAEPLVKAFSSCKVVLTTRMQDIEQYIPSKQSVTIGAMTNSEAIALLTNGVINKSQLSREDIKSLEELVEDLHLWPLLLSLLRGQLSYNLKHRRLTYHKAIEVVQTKLRLKGLTAFDKNNMEMGATNKYRKLAVKACVDATLELLTKSLSDKIKMLILWTGIGTSLSTVVLKSLWNTSEQEAEDAIGALWSYSLVQYTDDALSPSKSSQHYVEVHTTISQYIMDSIESKEAFLLSPYSRLGAVESVKHQLTLAFQQSYGVSDPSFLAPLDYLKYKQNELDSVAIPYYLKAINMQTTTDPHNIILTLQQVRGALKASPYTVNLLSSIGEEINSLIEECKVILTNAYSLCRKLNQNIQKHLYYSKDYDKIVESIKQFTKNYPSGIVAQKAVVVLEKVLAYFHTKPTHYVTWHEFLQIVTTDYHRIATLTLPHVRLLVKSHKKISSSLLAGTSDVEMTYCYFRFGQFDEDMKQVDANYMANLEKVAPVYVRKMTRR